MIELKNVFLSYTKDFNALQDVTMRVSQNERVVVFGAENSGKSSLLRVMVGLATPSAGEAFVMGIPAHKVDFKNIVSLAYLPVHPVFMENKSVLKNLEYPLEIRKIDKNLKQIKLQNVIKSYSLDAIKDIKMKELSYFDRVKVCIARFALRNVDIFVIDDVFKKLNDQETKKIYDYINDLIVANHATSVIATKNETLMKKLGGRVVVIDNGSLVN